MVSPLPVIANGDCWNEIGVYRSGDTVCPLLAEVVHCRNCEVFAGAGKNLLTRPPPPEYVREWTDVVREIVRPEEANAFSLLIFRLASEWLAIRTTVFAEVTEKRRVRSLPQRKDPALLGLVNIRGQLQFCISLKVLLGIEEVPSRAKPLSHVVYERMLMIERGPSRWVFQVDEVYGVRKFSGKDLREAPVTISKNKGNFTRGLFDLERGRAETHERRQNAVSFEQLQVAELDDAFLFEVLEQRMFSASGLG